MSECKLHSVFTRLYPVFLEDLLSVTRTWQAGRAASNPGSELLSAFLQRKRKPTLLSPVTPPCASCLLSPPVSCCCLSPPVSLRFRSIPSDSDPSPQDPLRRDQSCSCPSNSRLSPKNHLLAASLPRVPTMTYFYKPHPSGQPWPSMGLSSALTHPAPHLCL